MSLPAHQQPWELITGAPLALQHNVAGEWACLRISSPATQTQYCVAVTEGHQWWVLKAADAQASRLSMTTWVQLSSTTGLPEQLNSTCHRLAWTTQFNLSSTTVHRTQLSSTTVHRTRLWQVEFELGHHSKFEYGAQVVVLDYTFICIRDDRTRLRCTLTRIEFGHHSKFSKTNPFRSRGFFVENLDQCQANELEVEFGHRSDSSKRH